MAEPNTVSDVVAIINAAIPFIGGTGGIVGLYFYYRKIDADNRKLDREKIAQQHQELLDEREEHRKTRAERDAVQDKLNEAYKKLYPDKGGVTE